MEDGHNARPHEDRPSCCGLPQRMTIRSRSSRSDSATGDDNALDTQYEPTVSMEVDGAHAEGNAVMADTLEVDDFDHGDTEEDAIMHALMRFRREIPTRAVPGHTSSASALQEQEEISPWNRPLSELLFPESDTSDHEDVVLGMSDDLLPSLLERTSLRTERTRQLVTSFNRDCELSRSSHSSSANISRRVEKTVHLRLHRLCHFCHTRFGLSLACPSCRHVQCRDCTRAPPRQILDIVQRTKRMLEAQQQQQHQRQLSGPSQRYTPPFSEEEGLPFRTSSRIASAADAVLPTTTQWSSHTSASTSITTEPSAPSTHATSHATPHHSSAQLPLASPTCPIPQWLNNITQSLELETSPSDTEDSIPQEIFYPFLTAPRRSAASIGPSAIYKHKTQIHRRFCHICDTQFLPANRLDCASCGHTRCTMCPRDGKHAKYPHGSPGDVPAPPSSSKAAVASAGADTFYDEVPTRVYRKTRHAVRYTCDQCQTAFASRHPRCQSCGHLRCEHCIRYPPRRQTSDMTNVVVPTLHDDPLAAVT